MYDVTRCLNGHYYDRNEYSSCPHCIRGQQRTGSTMEYRQQVSHLAQQYLDAHRKNKQKALETVVMSAEKPLTIKPLTVMPSAEKPLTIKPLTVMPSAERPLEVKPLTVMPSAEKPLEVKPLTVMPSAESTLTGKRTVQESDESQTGRSYMAVGCLVCTGGPEYGYTYSLFKGRNVVCGCAVTYDELKNRFYLMPENGMVQLNGLSLSGFETIQTGDEIGVGENQFEFIAYCRGRRKWNPAPQNSGQNGGMG